MDAEERVLSIGHPVTSPPGVPPPSRLGHMQCSRSSLPARCQAAISWEQLPVCAGGAPAGPQPAPVSSVPRSRASHASQSPAGGQRCLHPRAGLGSCRPCLAVLGRVGSQAKQILWERVCSRNNRARPVRPLRWVGLGGEGLGRARGSAASWMRPWTRRADRFPAQNVERGGRACMSCPGAGCWGMLSTRPLPSGPQEGSDSS